MDYAVIMAGGAGKRLWPLSRQDRPKQVLRLLNGKSLLRLCLERIRPVIPPERILVLTNRQYLRTVQDELPELPPDQIIGEPEVRDTCSAIGVAAVVLQRLDPDPTMAVLTADQDIRPQEAFLQVLRDGLRFVEARPESMVTFGIRPTFPSTQLGYLKLGPAQSIPGCENTINAVEAFKEKPDLQTALSYLSSGQYLWNSGMFLWKARRILGLIRQFVPDAARPLEAIGAAWGTPAAQSVLDKQFTKMPKISIDYAVMEKASDVYTIRLDCQWSDVGSYQALAGLIGKDVAGNTVYSGAAELMDCHDTVVVCEDHGHLIACIGLSGMIVARSHNATLVCPIDQASRLKEFLDLLASHGLERYL